MRRIPIALQLHSVREECLKGLPGTLKAVADMGYEGVEFAGYFGYSAEELRSMLDGSGLKVAGTHSYWVPNSLKEENLAETVAFNRTLGNHVLVGGIGGIAKEERGLRSAWVELAERYNALAEKLAPEGILVGYHNHALEFELAINDEPVWEILYSALNRQMILQLDTGGAMRGSDCVSVLQRYPGRVTTIHLKPYSLTEGTRPLIGDDDLPWDDILHLCETVGGTEWYIVEYESDGYPRMEAVARCLDALKAMGR